MILLSAQKKYELLALALSYPKAELMTAIENGQFNQEFHKTAPIPVSVEELEVEYCRLFVGPGHVEVPPYESVYHGNDIDLQEGLVMGSSTLKVKEIYREAGLQLKNEFTDLPDHIAVETWFLAYLEAMAQFNQEEEFSQLKHQFIEEHLGQWAVPFIESVKKATRHPWYAFVSDLLSELLQAEQKVS